MCDNGCQPTLGALMVVHSTLAIRQASTSHNNPKGNADPERMMCTLKEGCRWLQK
jgi:hypothetical protein